MTKNTRAKSKTKREQRVDSLLFPKALGELITADRNIMNLERDSRARHRNALVVLDLFSSRVESSLFKRKNSSETVKCLRRTMLPTARWSSPGPAKNMLEITTLRHFILKTNGIAEGTVRRDAEWLVGVGERRRGVRLSPTKTCVIPCQMAHLRVRGESVLLSKVL